MSRLHSCLLVLMCFSHSLEMASSLQQSFKSDLLNFYHSVILADGKETTIHLLKDIPKR